MFGAVSDAMPRHLVQVIPLLTTMALLPARAAFAAGTAIGAFRFRAVVMAMIWPYLLGFADIASGH